MNEGSCLVVRRPTAGAQIRAIHRPNQPREARRDQASPPFVSVNFVSSL